MTTTPPPPTPTTPTPTPRKSRAQYRTPSSRTHADPPHTKTRTQNPLRNQPATAKSVATGRKGIRSGSTARKIRRGIRLIGGVARRAWMARVSCWSIWGSKAPWEQGGRGGFGRWRRLVSVSVFLFVGDNILFCLRGGGGEAVCGLDVLEWLRFDWIY